MADDLVEKHEINRFSGQRQEPVVRPLELDARREDTNKPLPGGEIVVFDINPDRPARTPSEKQRCRSREFRGLIAHDFGPRGWPRSDDRGLTPIMAGDHDDWLVVRVNESMLEKMRFQVLILAMSCLL